MDILRDSQLVIFSHGTTFITFSYKSLAVFLLNYCKVRGGENQKWRWIFAFDRCVGVQWLQLASGIENPFSLEVRGGVLMLLWDTLPVAWHSFLLSSVDMGLW